MYETPTLIEDIRTALAYSELVTPDKLEVYARRYAEECTKLNERLRLCLPHLRGGNLAEAVRIAETSPNIIETFNLLDFEGRRDWIEVCDGLGLDTPPPLVVEIFQELNDAYLQMVPLEPLLKWHRLYALSGAPLRDRLAVLRSLVRADPMNLPWQTDQETFEKARIAEIGRDITKAQSQNDEVRLQELYRELTDPGWRIAFPIQYRQVTCIAVLKQQANEFMQLCSALKYHGAVGLLFQLRDVFTTFRTVSRSEV
jgi:hypothetical protein